MSVCSFVFLKLLVGGLVPEETPPFFKRSKESFSEYIKCEYQLWAIYHGNAWRGAVVYYRYSTLYVPLKNAYV